MSSEVGTGTPLSQSRSGRGVFISVNPHAPVKNQSSIEKVSSPPCRGALQAWGLPVPQPPGRPGLAVDSVYRGDGGKDMTGSAPWQVKRPD